MDSKDDSSSPLPDEDPFLLRLNNVHPALPICNFVDIFMPKHTHYTLTKILKVKRIHFNISLLANGEHFQLMVSSWCILGVRILYGSAITHAHLTCCNSCFINKPFPLLQGIMEQFNPCLRNFIAMGKNYEKTLSSKYPHITSPGICCFIRTQAAVQTLHAFPIHL